MRKKHNIFDYINYMIMLIIAIITIYPFWNQLVVSLSSVKEIASNSLAIIPREITLNSYKLALKYNMLWIGYRNTIIRTTLGVLVSVGLTSLVAYPISKKDLPFRNIITGIILFTMIFSGGLIPAYLLIRNLHLMDSIWSLVLPSAISAFNVLIMRNFFMQIPCSMEESATIDGAGPMTIFIRIILPLSKPVIATVTLWVLVHHWNDWFAPYLYIKDYNKQVLQTVLRKIVIENDQTAIKMVKSTGSLNNRDEFSGEQLQATIMMLSILPMLVFYPCIQKHFVNGIYIGSIKG